MTWLIVNIIVCVFLFFCSDVLGDVGDVLEDGGDVLDDGGDVLEDGGGVVEDLLLLATSRLMRGLTGPWGGHARLAKLPSPLKPMPWSKLQKSKH